MKPGSLVADPRADRDREERAGAGAGRAASAARSSTAIRPRSIAASTSAPTRSPPAERRGIPHHLIDIADPTDEYTAAQYARDAAAAIRDIHARGRLPILVGGTGFYYRALTRGLFPGPGPRRRAARAARGDRRRGAASTFLHRMLRRVDPESAARIQPRDLKRLVRALEVFFLTGRPLTAHFADTRVADSRRRRAGDRRCGCRRRRSPSA